MITYVINTSENSIYDRNNLFENSMITLAGYSQIRWMNSYLDDIDSCTKEIFEQQSRLGVGPFRIAVLIDFYGFDRIRVPYGHGREGYGNHDAGVDFSLYLPYIESYLETHILNPLRYAEADPTDFSVYYVQNDKFDFITHIDNGVEQVRDHLIRWDAREAQEDGEDEADGIRSEKPGRGSPSEREDDLITCLHQALDDLLSPLNDHETSPKTEAPVADDGKTGLQAIPEKLRIEDLTPDTILREGYLAYDYAVTEFEETCRQFESDADELIKEYNLLKKAIAERPAGRSAREDREDIVRPEELYLENKRKLLSRREDLEKQFCSLLEKKRTDIDRYDSFTLYCTPSVSLLFRMKDYPGTGGKSFGEFHRLLEDMATGSRAIHRHFYPAFTTGGAARAAFDTLSLAMYLIWFYERGEDVEEHEVMEVYKIQPEVLREVLVDAWNKISCAQRICREYMPEYYSLDLKADTPEHEMPSDDRTAIIETMKTMKDESADSIYQRITDYAEHRKIGMDENDNAKFSAIMRDYLQSRDDIKSGVSDSEYAKQREESLLETTTQYPSHLMLDQIVNEKEKEISSMMDEALSMEYIQVDYSEEKKAADEAFQRYLKAKLSLRFNVIGDVLLLVFTLITMCGSYALLQVRGIASAPWLWVGLSVPVFAGLFLLSYFLRMLPYMRAMKSARQDLMTCCERCVGKNLYAMSRLRLRYIHILPAIESTRYTIRNIRNLYDINQSINARLKQHMETLNTIENSLSAVLSNLGVEPRRNDEVDVSGELDLTQDVNSPDNRIYRVLSMDVIERLLFPNGREDT